MNIKKKKANSSNHNQRKGMDIKLIVDNIDKHSKNIDSDNKDEVSDNDDQVVKNKKKGRGFFP